MTNAKQKFSIEDSPLWRAHLLGFLALLEFYGGVDAVIESANDPSPIFGLQYIFM